MSWSVSATGTPAEVRGQLSEQFKGPLAERPAGLADDGERETVQRIHEAIEQALATFGPDSKVSVSANGHMGFGNWDTKAGAYQNVNLAISQGDQASRETLGERLNAFNKSLSDRKP